LRYGTIEESKYTNTSSLIENGLAKILSRGIVPAFDPLNKYICNEAIESTISLTRSRAYASLYANLFATKGNSFSYEGSSQLRIFIQCMMKMAVSPDFKKQKTKIDFFNLGKE
jgi:hypothetical protein